MGTAVGTAGRGPAAGLTLEHRSRSVKEPGSSPGRVPGRASRSPPGAAADTVGAVTAVEAPAALPREAMTPRQLARRARLLEAVVAIVTEVGPQALQMREVAERSGVALGTAYKYFRSREQLMAAALAEWQQPLMQRMASAGRSADADPGELVAAYLRRALRAFHRNPHMGALMVLMQTSGDPDVVETLAEMGTRSTAVLDQLLEGLPPEVVPPVRQGVEAVLMNSVTALVTGRATLGEAQERVEAVARLLLAGARSAG